MRIRQSSLYAVLPLLALCTAVPAVAAPFRGAEIDLVVSASGGSALPIDLAKVAAKVCDGSATSTPMDPDPFDPMAKCTLTSHNPGPNHGGGSLKILVSPKAASDKAAPEDAAPEGFLWRVSRLALEISKPIETPCGLWDASLDLDAERAQPDSRVVLQEVAGDPQSGVLAGVLAVDAVLHLSHRETGRTVDLAVPLAFDVAARWSLAAADGSDPEEPRARLFLGTEAPEETGTSAEICTPARSATLDERGEPACCEMCWLRWLPRPMTIDLTAP
jgi:hypothetical protein